MHLSPILHATSCQAWAIHATASHPPCAIVKRCPDRPTKLIAEASALAALAQTNIGKIPQIIVHVPRGPNAHLILSWLCPQAITLDHWWPQASDTQKTTMAKAFGAWLAQVHNVHIAPGAVKLSDDPMTWSGRLRKHLRRAKKKLDKQLDENLPMDRMLLNDAIHKLETTLINNPWPTRPRAMMHRDLRPPNIIIDALNNQYAGTVDFERAGAGDPAWDFVKLQWWCFDLLPGFQAPFEMGYTQYRILPKASKVQIYCAFEAITMLGYFLGKHETYPKQAASALEDYLFS